MWPTIVNLPHYHQLFPRFPAQSLSRHFPALCPDGLSLLQRMLAYDPAKRISAREALEHPYFRDRARPTYRLEVEMQHSYDMTLKEEVLQQCAELNIKPGDSRYPIYVMGRGFQPGDVYIQDVVRAADLPPLVQPVVGPQTLAGGGGEGEGAASSAFLQNQGPFKLGDGDMQ